MRRRTVLTATGGVLATLAGCLDQRDGGTTSDPPGSASPTAESTTTPPYATCDPAAVSPDAPAAAGALPDSLTPDRVVEYAEAVERAFALPSNGDGYVQIADSAAESVAHGYLVRVPVTGGYYNRAADGTATETVHYDLAPYAARYFVTERVARRTRDTDSPADPREAGTLIACASDR